jgi:hypothetical protein
VQYHPVVQLAKEILDHPDQPEVLEAMYPELVHIQVRLAPLVRVVPD